MKILIITIIALLAMLTTVYAIYGGFTTIKCRVNEEGGETVVYQNVKGEYKQVGAVMDQIYYKLLDDYQIETSKGYAKYLDNPREVEKTKLRSEAGCVIEKKDLHKLENLPAELMVKTIDKQKYITAEFPFKGKLSIIVSIMKVYSALNKFAVQNKFSDQGCIVEIYDVPNNIIYYRKEVIN